MPPETTTPDHELLMDLRKAMFGDEEKGELGVYQMNREMYQAWSAIIWLGKAVTVIIAFIAALGTAWMAFGTWFKHIISGK